RVRRRSPPGVRRRPTTAWATSTLETPCCRVPAPNTRARATTQPIAPSANPLTQPYSSTPSPDPLSTRSGSITNSPKTVASAVATSESTIAGTSVTAGLWRSARKAPARICPKVSGRSGTNGSRAGGVQVGAGNAPVNSVTRSPSPRCGDSAVCAYVSTPPLPWGQANHPAPGHTERTRSMNARILVVDDDPAIAEMIGIILRGEGYDPLFAADGKAA